MSVILTFLHTNIYNSHLPIFGTLTPTGLLYEHTNFRASSLISKTLLSKANRGARGNAATKIVTKPNCRTRINKLNDNQF